MKSKIRKDDGIKKMKKLLKIEERAKRNRNEQGEVALKRLSEMEEKLISGIPDKKEQEIIGKLFFMTPKFEKDSRLFDV